MRYIYLDRYIEAKTQGVAWYIHSFVREISMKEMIMEGSIVSGGGCFSWLKGGKEYLLMIMLQFGSAGMYIMSMHAFNKGMSHYVLIVYRNAIAAITLAPFAIFLERYVYIY